MCSNLRKQSYGCHQICIEIVINLLESEIFSKFCSKMYHQHFGLLFLSRVNVDCLLNWAKGDNQTFYSCGSVTHGKPRYPAFERQLPWWKLCCGACFSKTPRTFRARKATSQTAIRLFSKADLLTYFEYKKKQENCEVWWLKTSALWRYKGNCSIQ